MVMNNITSKQTPAPWQLTRRDFLKSSGIAIAGLTSTTPLIYSEEPDMNPILRFGIVTDVHFADANSRGNRHYRDSEIKMKQCVEFMNQQKVDFLIELGDIKDQANPKLESSTLEFLRTIEKHFTCFNGPRYHVLGNHERGIAQSQRRFVPPAH